MKPEAIDMNTGLIFYDTGALGRLTNEFPTGPEWVRLPENDIDGELVKDRTHYAANPDPGTREFYFTIGERHLKIVCKPGIPVASISEYAGPDATIEDDGLMVASSSRGYVGWKHQAGRSQAPPPTPEQLEEERLDPYGLEKAKREAAATPVTVEKKEPPAAVPTPAAPDPPGKKEEVKPIMPFQKTQEEIDDPYGLKRRDEPASKSDTPEESTIEKKNQLEQEIAEEDSLEDPSKE